MPATDAARQYNQGHRAGVIAAVSVVLDDLCRFGRVAEIETDADGNVTNAPAIASDLTRHGFPLLAGRWTDATRPGP